MSQREAAVKLTLDDAQFISSMRHVGDEAAHAGKKGHEHMGLFQRGIHGAEHAVHGLHRSLETVTEMVTGLAAGFSVEEALKTTIELDSRFQHLAFRISTANGQMVKARDIQEMVEEAADKTGIRTVKLAEAFDEVEKSSGDAKFAGDILEAIGTTAQATGENVVTLGQLAEELHSKFHVSGRAMAETLAHVVEASAKGGPALGELTQVADVMGAELMQAGLTGKRGLDFMLGSLVRTKHEFGSIGKQVKGVKALLLALGDQNKLKELGKEAGIDPKALLREDDLLGRLRMVLGKGTAGINALKHQMHESEEQKALKILFLDPFEDALSRAGKAGKKGKSQIDDALDALDQNIGHFGDSVLDYAALEKEAADRRKDPKQALDDAMEQLERAFGSPEILKGLNDMSHYLPPAAAGLANFVKMGIEHPLLGGAAAVTGAAGLGFTKSMIQSGIEIGAQKGWASLKQFFTAKERGLGMDKWMESDASRLFNRITDAHVMGGIKVGNILSVALIAAAAEMGREFIKAKAEEDAKTTGDLSAAGAAAMSTTTDIKRQEEQANNLRDKIAKAKESRSGAGGLMESVFSGWAGLISGEPGAASQKDAQIADMEKLLEEKEKFINMLKEDDRKRPDAEPEKPHHAKEPLNHKQIGAGLADKLLASTLRVHVVNGVGSFAAPGPGGSRGPRPPAPARPGGGY